MRVKSLKDVNGPAYRALTGVVFRDPIVEHSLSPLSWTIDGIPMAAGLEIIAFGIPGPQGSKSFKGLNSKRKPILVESSQKVKPWRDAVFGYAREARGAMPPMDGPIIARMIFTLPKPASAPKKRTIWPMRKPDLSKLVRSTEDALTDARVIADDARIVEYLRVAKVFPNEDPEALDCPGARIVLIQRGAL